MECYVTSALLSTFTWITSFNPPQQASRESLQVIWCFSCRSERGRSGLKQKPGTAAPERTLMSVILCWPHRLPGALQAAVSPPSTPASAGPLLWTDRCSGQRPRGSFLLKAKLVQRGKSRAVLQL